MRSGNAGRLAGCEDRVDVLDQLLLSVVDDIVRGQNKLVIFPEGGRGQPDGSMIEFKGGAARLALEADVPILPVTIRGANRVWPAGRHLPRLAQVEITYHPLFLVEQRPNEEKSACARRESDRLAGIIRTAL